MPLYCRKKGFSQGRTVITKPDAPCVVPVVRFVRLQIDQLKQELSKKESELLALQTKLETLNNQNSDCKQHIEVLKESLTAKEQRAAILQTEVMKNVIVCLHTIN